MKTNAAKTDDAVARVRRILLVEDHAVFRQSFAQLINCEPDLEVCGQAATAGEAVNEAKRLKPDLVVADLVLQEGSGLDLVKNLKKQWPLLAVLVLSMHDRPPYPERALAAGANGYVAKSEESATVLKAIRAVLAGGMFVSDSFRNTMFNELAGIAAREDPHGLSRLSNRQLEVFGLIGNGCDTKQIATRLNIGITTVEVHRVNIRRKLGFASRIEMNRAAAVWVGAGKAARA